MQVLERYSDPEELLRVAQDSLQSGIWTALPGIIKDYDATKLTCTVQPATMGKQQVKDSATGSVRTVDVRLPLLLDVPICFPHSTSGHLTFPIAAGDEVLVIFASRCIDAWWQNGGTENVQMEMRMHDLSDGFAVLAPYSQPKVISGVSTDKVQLRNTAGDTVIELDPSGQTVNITAPGGAVIVAETSISGDTAITGLTSMNGNANITGRVTAASAEITGSALMGSMTVTGTASMGSLSVAGGSTLGSVTAASLATSSNVNSPAITLSGTSGGYASGMKLNNTTPSTGKNYGLYSSSAGEFRIDDNTTLLNRLVIGSNGNVGIGGAAARQQLSVGANLDIYSASSILATGPAIRADNVGNITLNGGTGDVYLNFDKGSGRTNFGNGAGNVTSSVDNTGKFTGTGLNITNAANITFGSNWQTWTPTMEGPPGMTFTSISFTSAIYMRIGPMVFFSVVGSAIIGGTPAGWFGFLLPTTCLSQTSVTANFAAGGSGTYVPSAVPNTNTSNVVTIWNAGMANLPAGSITFLVSGFYRCA